MSVLGSVPISFASSVLPEKNSTEISSAPSMTWLLVTMYPSSEITKPEPSAFDRCGPRGASGLPKRLKKSSKGDPSGTIGPPSVGVAIVVDVVMLTTAGLTFSARSANESGAARASDGRATARVRARPMSIATRNPASGSKRRRTAARVAGCDVTVNSLL